MVAPAMSESMVVVAAAAAAAHVALLADVRDEGADAEANGRRWYYSLR